MERALLERMVGAVVLVLLLVVLAPALLDGRDDSANNRMVADAPVDAGTRTEVIVLNAPVTAPPPESVETVVAVAPAAGSSRSSETGDSEAQTPSPGQAPPEGYAVQVNAFADRRNAERYAAEVKGAGFAVFVIRGESPGGALYRVYSGPVGSRDAAGNLAAKLQGKGYKGIVVQLDGNKRG